MTAFPAASLLRSASVRGRTRPPSKIRLHRPSSTSGAPLTKTRAFPFSFPATLISLRSDSKGRSPVRTKAGAESPR